MHENFQIPDVIDAYIARGIESGRKKKRQKRLKQLSGMIACLVLALLITGIRVSPVLAANVAKIPGLKYIVELVRFDKGLTSAIDNNYIQNVDKVCEKSGIKLTVKDIIADNSGIIIFYSIENKGNYKWPQIAETKLLDANGNQLKLSCSYGYSPSEEKSYDGKIDFHFVNDPENDLQPAELPNKVILQTQIAVSGNITNSADSQPVAANRADASEQKKLEGVWSIEIAVDKTKFSQNEKVYDIGQRIIVEDQKIIFENIKIYPTKSILSVRFDPTNSKRIFTFEDLKLIDQNGEEWGRINNGMTGTIGENSQTLYFQSNYFYTPKELYLTGSSVRALDKEKCHFEVDIEKKELIYSPYNLLSVSRFSLYGSNLSLELLLQNAQEDLHNNYDISNEAYDAAGNKVEITSSGMGSSEKESFLHYELRLAEKTKGPITFKIHDYPSRIKKNFKIKIPLD